MMTLALITLGVLWLISAILVFLCLRTAPEIDVEEPLRRDTFNDDVCRCWMCDRFEQTERIAADRLRVRNS
jgi:hypothetical protein